MVELILGINSIGDFLADPITAEEKTERNQVWAMPIVQAGMAELKVCHEIYFTNFTSSFSSNIDRRIVFERYILTDLVH